MKIYDVSLPISPALPVWPGNPAVVLEKTASMDAGAHDNISRLACSVHTGTHVDAPHHFLNDHRTVEALALDVLVGPALVVQIPEDASVVNAEALEKAGLPAGTERLLLKTSNSRLWERGENTFFRVLSGFRRMGPTGWCDMDQTGGDRLPFGGALPPEHPHPPDAADGRNHHRGRAGPSAIQPGSYGLFCLPLKLVGSDGAPARVILQDLNKS